LLAELADLEEMEVSTSTAELDGSFLTDENVPQIIVRKDDDEDDTADGTGERGARLGEHPDEPQGKEAFHYQEWHYLEGRYLRDWVSLFEVEHGEGDAEVVDNIIAERRELIEHVRRQFRMMRSETVAWRKKLEAGDEVDIWEAVNALADRKAGLQPSDKLYMERRVRNRDISALMLLDMSASTDAKVRPGGSSSLANGGGPSQKKVIDVAREGLVVLAEALEQLGDAYGVYGFSGYGRHNVEYYPIKYFREGMNARVKSRIAAISPKKSTRMGPAIRHSTNILERQGAREKLLIIISDGYPQDHDYGDDRRSREYGLQDTRAAMREAESRNIRPFCLTIDLAGNDYLRRICKPSGYMVLEDIASLPEELPKLYSRLR
ncbi:MAG: hypothetical protein CVU59_06920, partial [Deltaproteobacteria bacterium HGW-Deltaproteobacteria-17]